MFARAHRSIAFMVRTSWACVKCDPHFEKYKILHLSQSPGTEKRSTDADCVDRDTPV